jgi:hypothetical protein
MIFCILEINVVPCVAGWDPEGFPGFAAPTRSVKKSWKKVRAWFNCYVDLCSFFYFSGPLPPVDGSFL